MQRKILHSLGIISKAIEKYPKIAMASSYGKDSMVTLHLCRQLDSNMKIMVVTTPYWFEETKHYRNTIKELWKLNEMVSSIPNHDKVAVEDVEKCCDYYKVEPLKKMIEELKLDAWISGLRNTEGHTREFTKEIEELDGLVKINPILTWTEAEVFLYHAMNNIPVHPLYAQGYRSIGCEPCSKPYTCTERGGRWQGTCKEAGECGIHTKSLRKP